VSENSHVFISYSRNDGKAHAEKLEKALQKKGFSTWRDIRDIHPTQDFTADIEIGIEEASHVVVCVTSDAKVRDSFVRREIQYALTMNKPVIPLRFDSTKPHISVITYEWLEFFKDWDGAFERLCQILGEPEYQPPPQSSSRPQAAPVKRPSPASPVVAPLTPSPAASPSPVDPFRPYLQVLLKNVVDYLKQAVVQQIDLKGRSTPAAVSQPHRTSADMFSQMFAGIAIADEDTQERTVFTTFGEAFTQYGGRVLLLGEPGAGKTITLMTHTRRAVTARLHDMEQPLPLFGNVATWDSQERPPLVDWLASKYRGLETNAVQAEINQGNALLLLDGLDELGRERLVDPDKPDGDKYDPRLRFLESLLPILETAERNQVFITCRREEFREIGKRIPLTGAVTLNPLDDDQMREYLHKYGDLWALLERDAKLREVARTPLLLSLFTYAFRALDEEVQALQSLSQGESRDKIFSTYIERRYKHEATTKQRLPYRLEFLVDKLGQLAMHNRGDWWATDNVLRPEDISTVFGRKNSGPFLKMAVRLHLLTPVEDNSLRFIHLLLRDYLAYREAVKVLKEKHSDASMRLIAVEALGKIGDPRAVEALILALRDENNRVRRATAEALGELGDSRAVAPLITALQDRDANVRYIATSALGELGDDRAVASLVQMLSEAEIDRSLVSYNLINAVAVSLGQLGDAGFEALIAALQDEDVWVCQSAVMALGELENPRAVEPLEQLLSHTDMGRLEAVRELVTKALRRLDTPNTSETVTQTQTMPRIEFDDDADFDDNNGFDDMEFTF
jgi:hypothetical protein